MNNSIQTVFCKFRGASNETEHEKSKGRILNRIGEKHARKQTESGAAKS